MITTGLFMSLLLAVIRSYSALECPEKWTEFEGFCYKVMDRLGYPRRFAWSTALRGCIGFGGDLVSISNEKEKKFVHNLSFKDTDRTSVWIGLAFRHQTGGYVWNNGELFNSSVSVEWIGNMSRRFYENKCVEILKNGWKLSKCCEENKYFICERPKGPLACSTGWFLNGVSCYKENNKDTWEGARKECTASGGDLVKINNARDEKHRFLIHFMEIMGLKKTNINYVWIGQTNDSKCRQIKTDTGTIEKGNCEDQNNYICERPALTSTLCYQYPSKNSSDPITVKCVFPENLCFKYDNKAVKGHQITIQGCISADQCRQLDEKHLHCCEGHLCNSVMNTTISAGPGNPKVIYISLGATSAILLLSIPLFVWCYRRTKLKNMKSSPDSQPSDKWEILPGQIEFEGELGRGEFGVVYKATFRQRVEMEVLDTETSKRPLLSTTKAPQVVAVKVLHDDPSEAQKEEFAFEIEQMKLLGSHKNVVSMVGCCTLEDKSFLVIEYVPYGDLLTWLRRGRKKINALKASERSYADKEALKDHGETRDQESKPTNETVKEQQTYENTKLTEINEKVQQELASTFHSHLEKQEDKLLKKTSKEEQTHVTMEMTSLRQSDVTPDMASATDNLPDQRLNVDNEAMDDEHSVNQKQVNITVYPPESVKVTVLEVIPSTSTEKIERAEWKVTDKELLSSQGLTGKSQVKPSPAISPLIENFDDDSSEEEDDEDSFHTKQLFSFAWQIAKGMNHLAENNLVHRDLAARNVLVGRDNKIKVSDFGLMRQIYEDVSSSAKSKKLPVKWMSPESLYQGVYTTKSDVWSFGVVLWEMATLGDVPYPTLTNSELYRLLGTGYRMERPDMCSDDVYELMSDCWKEDPRNRPSFFRLIQKMEVIMERDAPYLDVNRDNEAHSYYNLPPEASAD